LRGLYLEGTSIPFEGSKHPVYRIGSSRIKIGCYIKTIKEWKRVYKAVGELEGYSKKEIKEYKSYIFNV
jgi:hypothetical protein